VATISSNKALVESGTDSSWLCPKSFGSLSGPLVEACSALRGVSDERGGGLDGLGGGGGGPGSRSVDEIVSVLRVRIKRVERRAIIMTNKVVVKVSWCGHVKARLNPFHFLDLFVKIFGVNNNSYQTI
jgi:hypothetical protein